MAEKYRVQFNNEIIGPYSADEIKKLVRKGYFPRFIRCNPVTEEKWYSLLDIPGFEDLSEESVTESSLVLKLKEQFGNKQETTQIQKKLKRKKDKVKSAEINTQKKKYIKEKEDIDLSSTLITKDTYDYLEENKKGIEKNLEKALKKQETEPEEEQEDRTQFYNVEEIKNALVEADETEKKLEEEKVEDLNEKEIEELPKKNKKNIVTILAILLIILFLLDDDGSTKKKNNSFIVPKFSIPVLGNEINDDKALSILDEASGLVDYKLPDLLKRSQIAIKAARFSENDKVLSYLANTYVDLLPYSEKISSDGAKVFKILSYVKSSKDLKKPRSVNLRAKFFLNVNKPDAAIYLIEQYRKLNDKITEGLTSTYLRALIKVGNIKDARKIVNGLIARESLKVRSYLAILEYLEIENNYEDYGSAFARAYNEYPDSLAIIFHGIRYYLFTKENKKVQSLLETVKAARFEFNRAYYSQYLETLGVVLAMSGQYKEARKYFSKAIDINPESEIIAKLSTLENNEQYSEISQLVAKSKSINYIIKARKNFEKNNFELALTNAINATDIYPDYLPAQKLLIEIQIEYGYLEEAIKSLNKIRKTPRRSKSFDILLLKAYAYAYKFREGLVIIQELNQKLGNDPEYAEVVALFYQNKKDLLRSILWLQKAIKINPLQESALYRLSKIYLENNQFDRARNIINRLIDLNPSKIDYKILYADIIYEIQDVDTGLGYLRGLEKDYPDNSKIKHKIAMFFYRSGQIKSFESLKAEIGKDINADSELYLFLMKAAQVEQKYGEVLKNAELYLSHNRADHSVRIILAQTYFDLGKFEEAEAVLLEIQEKINSYPRLHYLLSKVAMLKGDSESAIELARKEIALNRFASYGYIQLGNIYRQNEEWIKAEAQYKKAQRLDPDNIELLKGLAEVKFRRNQLEAALDIFKKVLETSGQVEIEVHYRIGEVYRYLGQSRLAIESYKTYLELNPQSENAEKIKSIIKKLK